MLLCGPVWQTDVGRVLLLAQASAQRPVVFIL